MRYGQIIDVRSFYRSRTELSEKVAPSAVSAPQLKLPILQPSRTSRCAQPSSIAAAAITKKALLSPSWPTSGQSADRHVFASVQVTINCGGLWRHQQVLRDNTAWMQQSGTRASDHSAVCNPKKNQPSAAGTVSVVLLDPPRRTSSLSLSGIHPFEAGDIFHYRIATALRHLEGSASDVRTQAVVQSAAVGCDCRDHANDS